MTTTTEQWAPRTLARLSAELRRRRASIAHAAEAFHAEVEAVARTTDTSDLLDVDEPCASGGDESRALAALSDAKLREVEAALSRLDAGTYGLCERCGGRISIHRLRALPAASVCLGCKRDW